jgi:hypothetical protein
MFPDARDDPVDHVLKHPYKFFNLEVWSDKGEEGGDDNVT